MASLIHVPLTVDDHRWLTRHTSRSISEHCDFRIPSMHMPAYLLRPVESLSLFQGPSPVPFPFLQQISFECTSMESR